MKILEVIAIRSADTDKKEKAWKALQIIEGLQVAGGPTNVKMYRGAILETDLSIHIHWDTEIKHRGKSPFGLQLAQTLSNVGLVSHSVWMEGCEGER